VNVLGEIYDGYQKFVIMYTLCAEGVKFLATLSNTFYAYQLERS
jgi:hypothetical protein